MHDKKDRELKVGDVVLVPCRIMSLGNTEDYCNVTLKTIYGRRPDNVPETIYAINTGVLLRANSTEDDLHNMDTIILDRFSPVPTAVPSAVPAPVSSDR